MRTPGVDLSHSCYMEGGLVLGLQPILEPRGWKVEAVATPGVRVRVVRQKIAKKLGAYLFF